MYAQRTNLMNQFKGLGLGIAIAAAPFFAGQANAQQSPNAINFSDIQATQTYGAPTSKISPNSVVVASQATPAIKSIHQFALDQQGMLTGRVTTLKKSPLGLDVFIVANKTVLANAKTDSTGTFVIKGIAPGTYSMFVAGQNQIAAQGISITGPTNQPTSNELALTTIGTSYDGVKQLIDNAILPEIVSATQKNTSQISIVLSDEEVTKKVRIINGRIRGQISSLIAEDHAAGVQVHLIQNNQPIAQVQTNALGSFVIPDVDAGTYDFVAVGKHGFAAIRVEVIGNRSPMSMVSYQADISSALEVPLAEDAIPARQVSAQTEVDYQQGNEVFMEPANLAPIQYASESIGYGGAGGGVAGAAGNFSGLSGGGGGFAGGGFGGGGGLGGSGLRRLLRLGAIGGVIVAIADDDPGAASPASR